MHASALEVCNEALITLGEDVTLENLSKESSDPKERKCAYLYESARKQVLVEHPWGFVREETNLGTGLKRLDVPLGALRVIACLDHEGYEIPYVISGGMIEADKCVWKIIWSRDEEDIGLWDTDARRALVLRLAADLAKPITGRINERKLQEEAYRDQIERAKLRDAKSSKGHKNAWGRNYYADVMAGRRELGV